MFKKLREWVREEHERDVELDEKDQHEHEYRAHSGHYEEIGDDRIFVWEVDMCRRCHKKRKRPKPHKKKTKSVTIEVGIPVVKKELLVEDFIEVALPSDEPSDNDGKSNKPPKPPK